MALNTRNFATILSNAAAAAQGAANQLLDFSVGSILRAVFQAAGGIALWLQGIGLQVAAMSRLATCNGNDVDTFGADFGFYRLPAQGASGQVTFGRYTASAQATIMAATQSGTDSSGNPIWAGGATVQTGDSSQQYMVIPDATQAAYSAALNAYVIAAGTSSASVTVKATTPGAASNAARGMINSLGSSIPGIDTVTNTATFTNGADQETDATFKLRFVLYIGSLEKATLKAVIYAIKAIQQNTFQAVTENQDYSGAVDRGYFYVVVDDGTGAPPSSFINTAFNAVDAVRPIGSVFGVFPSNPVIANVQLIVSVAGGYSKAAVSALITAALTTYINSLDIGDTLPVTKLIQLAWDASPGVTNVSNVTVNGSSADLSASGQQAVRAGAVSIS